jgi:hypothetical protein
MKKNMIAASSLCVIVVVLAGFTPALATKPTTPIINQTTIPIEATRYEGMNPVRTITSVSPADAWQIKQCLIELYNAQEKGDRITITRCIAVLKNKGIAIDTRDQNMLLPRGVPSFGKTPVPGVPQDAAADNITNAVCFFNAIGQGMLYGTFAIKFIKSVASAIDNQTSVLAKFILLLVLLPLVMVVILLNDLIPFRIMMPAGALVLANGTVSSIGLLGVKRMKVNATQIGVNVSWFTGLTINIPPLKNESKPFTFVSGFAAKVEGPFYG